MMIKKRRVIMPVILYSMLIATAVVGAGLPVGSLVALVAGLVVLVAIMAVGCMSVDDG